MHIDLGTLQRTALFFFAHQDDEFGVFQHILLAKEAGYRVCCAYLTSGVSTKSDPSKRDEESLKVLLQLGISREDIFFAGSFLKIPDGQLMRNLNGAIDWISGWLTSFKDVATIFLPAWEGGHPDHDALHVAVLVSASRDIPRLQLLQYPLYNSYRCWGPLFRVHKPLPANGQIKSCPIPWRRRIQFLRYCLSYPSQFKSWLGLFPFTLFHYVAYGIESTQDVSLQRLSERPHGGALYYERRHFTTWHEMHTAVEACLARNQLTLHQQSE